MDFSFSDLNFNSVETLLGYQARAAFTVNSASVFREDVDIVPTIVDDTLSYRPWGGDKQMPFDLLALVEKDETLATCQCFNAEVCYGSGLQYCATEASASVKSAVEDFLLDNDIASYYLGVCQDFKHFGFAVSVIILSHSATIFMPELAILNCSRRGKSAKSEIVAYSPLTTAKYFFDFLRKMHNFAYINTYPMKQKIKILILMFCICLVSCTTSKTTISQSADLYKYQYASLTDVMNYQGSAALMDAEVKIYDAIDNSRLQMIGDQAIGELSYEQKQQLLLVRFGVTQNDEESIVTVNFVDYFTGRPVASCRGAFGLGMDRQGDFNGAIKRVASQIEKTFPKN